MILCWSLVEILKELDHVQSFGHLKSPKNRRTGKRRLLSIGINYWFLEVDQLHLLEHRISHSAAIVGKQNSQKMVIVGGTDSSRGASRGSMLFDAWILDLNGAQHDPIWIKLDLSGRQWSKSLQACHGCSGLINRRLVGRI